MKKNLYQGFSIPKPPYERGTYCVTQKNLGYVLATNKKEAKNYFERKCNQEEELNNILNIRRVPSNIDWARKELEKLDPIREWLENNQKK